MTKTFTAPFAQAPSVKTAVAVAACVIGSADAPTNTVLLATAGTEGALVTSVWALPRATVSATGLYLFASSDGGATRRLIDSELMAAYTLTATTAIPETKFANYSEITPLRLGANESLYFGAAVALAAGIVGKCEMTDF